jgi:hypothetical protein
VFWGIWADGSSSSREVPSPVAATGGNQQVTSQCNFCNKRCGVEHCSRNKFCRCTETHLIKKCLRTTQLRQHRSSCDACSPGKTDNAHPSLSLCSTCRTRHCPSLPSSSRCCRWRCAAWGIRQQPLNPWQQGRDDWAGHLISKHHCGQLRAVKHTVQHRRLSALCECNACY